MKQICEYCRTHVDPLREGCTNCGAPVPKFHPDYNTYGSPNFVQDVLAMQNTAMKAQFMRELRVIYQR